MRKLVIANSENTPLDLAKYVIKQSEIIDGSIDSLMNNGRFIIININDLNIVITQTLVLYIAKYRYEFYCLKSLEDNFYIKIAPEMSIKFINNINEIEDTVINLSEYNRIVHIGDIHGSYDVLMEAWKKLQSPNCFYIFLGDLIDRGKKNDKVMEFILSVYKSPNVLLIEGNHDTNLWNWSIDNFTDLTKSFKDTKVQLEKSNISKKEVKKLCYSMKENVVYKYNEKTVIVSHGGLQQYPCKRYMIDTSNYIRSQCNDYIELDKLFTENVKNIGEIFQVHGHSNFFSIKSNANINSFNLEGGVELGGSLRVSTLSKNGFRFYYYKNKDSIMKNYIKYK